MAPLASPRLAACAASGCVCLTDRTHAYCAVHRRRQTRAMRLVTQRVRAERQAVPDDETRLGPSELDKEAKAQPRMYAVCRHVLLEGVEATHLIRATRRNHGEVLCTTCHRAPDIRKAVIVCPECVEPLFAGKRPDGWRSL